MGLSDILCTSTSSGNLLRLANLRTNGIDAEVLEREALDSVDAEDGAWVDDGEAAGEEELLAATALLNNLDHTRLELLDGRHVVGEDTHLSGLGGDVDLDDVLGAVDLLQYTSISAVYPLNSRTCIPATSSSAPRMNGPTRRAPSHCILPAHRWRLNSLLLRDISTCTYLVRKVQAQLDLQCRPLAHRPL